MIPAPLEQFIRQLSRLPGLGPRSAGRVALHLLTNPEKARELERGLREAMEKVVTCTICGNIGLTDPCHVCSDENRDATTLCVVEGVDDLWALEKSGAYRGHYHVLGGVVSAINGVGPEDLRMNELFRRVEKGGYKEVILALGASVDGQTTGHLIARRLKELPGETTLSALAKGMPMGADVDYLDEGTLSLALRGRSHLTI